MIGVLGSRGPGNPSTGDLSKVYQGGMIEYLVGHELLAFPHQSLSALHFWVREKKTSVAEVDHLFPFEGKLIPVEVRSGSVGKLRYYICL
ncbi:MAG: hypothetical protein ACOYXT_10070 [Bacteroidota bacterium]